MVKMFYCDYMEKPVNETVEHNGSVNETLNRSQEERRHRVKKRLGVLGFALLPIGFGVGFAGFIAGLHALAYVGGAISIAGFLLRAPIIFNAMDEKHVQKMKNMFKGDNI